MNRIIAFVLFTAASSLIARADITFTPKNSTRELDGIRFPQLEFRDGTQTITYEPPMGWTYGLGDAHTVKFYPRNAAQAEAAIQETLPLTPFATTPEAIKQLHAAALTVVPKEAQKVEIVAEEPSPLKMGGRDTYEITVSFVLFAQKFKMNVLFVDLGKSMLRVTLSCREAEFDQFHKAFRGSLYSWQWL